jgi:hypothetical protein
MFGKLNHPNQSISKTNMAIYQPNTQMRLIRFDIGISNDNDPLRVQF